MASTTKLNFVIEELQQDIIVDLNQYVPESVVFTFRELNQVLLSAIDNTEIVSAFTCNSDKEEITSSTLLNTRLSCMHLIPGLYPIYVGSEVYYYEVTPQNIDKEEYDLLWNSLLNKFGGLIFSNCRQAKFFKYKFSGAIKDNTVLESFIKEVHRVLVKIDLLKPEQHYILTKVMTRKGVVVQTSLNSPENRLLCRDLKNLKREVLCKGRILQDEIKALKQEIKSILVEVGSNFDMASKSYDIDKRLMQLTNYSKDRARAKVDDMKQMVMSMNNKLFQLQSIITRLDTILGELKLPLGQSENIRIKNTRYLVIHRDIQSICSGNKFHTLDLRLKGTELLFEYYNIALVLDTLAQQGYYSDKDSLYNLASLIKGYSCKFSDNKNHLIEVIYDREFMLGKLQEGIVNLNSTRNRPDIVLNLFEDGRYISTIIIEVKYRNSSYLYNTEYRTKTVSALMDYKQLGYNERGDLKTGTVSTILLAYPKQDVEVSPQGLDALVFRPAPIDIKDEGKQFKEILEAYIKKQFEVR